MGKKGKEATRDAKREKQAAKASKKLLKEAEEDTPIQFLLQQLEPREGRSTTEIVVSQQPSARTGFSFLSTKGSSFWLFGGEYFDLKSCFVYRDLFKWSPGKENEWKIVKCAVEPKPRCGHQAIITSEELLVFGGEFATKSQFYHFRDLWRFDLKSMVWEQLSTTGVSPSARSGHRMVMCRGYLVLFGGFHDASKETRYFNDVFVYHKGNWRKMIFPPLGAMPSPRSGGIMAATPNGVFIYGGYAKIRDSEKGAQGITYQDGWFLNLEPVFQNYKSGIPTWEKIPRRGVPPLRNGYGVCAHKNIVYVFGGVIDDDRGGLTLRRSFFFNDIITFNILSRKWSYLTLSMEKSSSSKTSDETNQQKEITNKPSATRWAFVENHGKLSKVAIDPMNPFQDDDDRLSVLENDVSWLEHPKVLGQPLPRIGASVCVKDNHLYVFGGTLEIGELTIVLDDCWRFHLGREVQWRLVLPGSYWAKNWHGVNSSVDSEEQSETMSGDSDSSLQSDDDSDEAASTHIAEDELQYASDFHCDENIPKEGESLRAFYDRTKLYWRSLVPRELENSEKELLAQAFQKASERYRDVQAAAGQPNNA